MLPSGKLAGGFIKKPWPVIRYKRYDSEPDRVLVRPLLRVADTHKQRILTGIHKQQGFNRKGENVSTSIPVMREYKSSGFFHSMKKWFSNTIIPSSFDSDGFMDNAGNSRLLT